MSKFQRRILVIEGLPWVGSALRALLAGTGGQTAQSAKVLDALCAAAPEKLLIDLRCAEADLATVPQKIKNASIGFVGRVLVLAADANGAQAFQEICELVRQHSGHLQAQHLASQPLLKSSSEPRARVVSIKPAA
jgi:DNA-binding NtrC family response regulator